jgi:hypothetical protein
VASLTSMIGAGPLAGAEDGAEDGTDEAAAAGASAGVGRAGAGAFKALRSTAPRVKIDGVVRGSLMVV